jgi:hypothetical protein
MWHTNTTRPEPNQTAIIAVQCLMDGAPFALGIYRWHEAYGCWMHEETGLKLKRDAYWWQAESDLLAGLPC